MTETFLFIITVETVPSSHTCFKTKASFILDVSFFPVITNVSDVWGLVAAHAERCVENLFFPERIVCVCVFFLKVLFQQAHLCLDLQRVRTNVHTDTYLAFQHRSKENAFTSLQSFFFQSEISQ